MDKKFLVESNLMEAHKQFVRLCNESYFSSVMNEAGDEEDMAQGPNGEGGQQEPPMGDDMQPMGGDMGPMSDNQPQGPDNSQEPMNDGPMSGQGMQGPDQMPPLDEPMPGENGMDLDDDNITIDVEDLTQAQEKLNKKSNMLGQDLGKVDGRIESLLSAVEDMKKMIDVNNQRIISLSTELEKRIPTQTERLGMRSLDTYPYNVQLADYWKDKEADGVYQAKYENGQQPKEKQKLTLTADDVNNYSPSEIEKSLDDTFKGPIR